jgi:hypothetical protein
VFVSLVINDTRFPLYSLNRFQLPFPGLSFYLLTPLPERVPDPAPTAVLLVAWDCDIRRVFESERLLRDFPMSACDVCP